MEIVNEDLLDSIHTFVESYKAKDFETLWSVIHTEDKARLFGIYFGKESEDSFRDFAEEWVYGTLEDYMEENLEKYEGVASNIRVNEHGIKYVLLTENERIGDLYTEPTQIRAIYLHFKEEYVNDEKVYKIKLYGDNFPDDLDISYH